jgi:hypothetical protein
MQTSRPEVDANRMNSIQMVCSAPKQLEKQAILNENDGGDRANPRAILAALPAPSGV